MMTEILGRKFQYLGLCAQCCRKTFNIRLMIMTSLMSTTTRLEASRLLKKVFRDTPTRSRSELNARPQSLFRVFIARGSRVFQQPARDPGTFSLTLHQDVSPVEAEWRELETVGVATIYQSFDWVENWCRTAAPVRGEVPLIVAGRRADGSLAFVWPFAMTRRYGVKTLSWLGQSYDGYFLGVYGPDVMPLLTRPVMSSLLRDITRERPDLAALHLLRMPLTWQGQGNPFARLTRQPFLPSYEMKLRKEFKELYESCFSGLSRNKIARGDRKLAALGALIDFATSPEERLAVYETFKQQKAVQLAAAGQGNVFEDTAIDAFFTAVFSCTELRSFELDLSSLRVGPDIGATSIGARFKDRYYGMQTSLGDFEFKKLSPGFLLKRDAIARQCKCGASAFDLGPGAGWHKDSWHPSKLPRFATCIPLKPTGVLATALSIADLRARSAARRSRLVSKILGVAQSASPAPSMALRHPSAQSPGSASSRPQSIVKSRAHGASKSSPLASVPSP